MKKYIIAFVLLILVLLLDYAVSRAQERKMVMFEKSDDMCGLCLTSSIYQIGQADTAEYEFMLKSDIYSNTFTFADICDLMLSIRALDCSDKSNVFINDKFLFIQKLRSESGVDIWSILLNADQGNKYLEIKDIKCFVAYLRLNALELLNLTYK